MKLRSLVALAALVATGAANASLLDGQTINYQYYFPDTSSPYPNAPNGNYLVGAAVEITNFLDGHGGDIDLSDTQIAVLFGDVAIYGATFNGFRINDVNMSIASFGAVTINGATNVLFDPSRISFDADNIWVNLQDSSYAAGDMLVLDVSAVPEPQTYPLMLLGLVGVAAVSRRAKRRD